MSTYLRGAGGAPGIALGRAVRYVPAELAEPTEQLSPEDALTRFSSAQATAAEQLRALAEQLRSEGRAAEAEIFEAQAMLVEDTFLTDEVTRRVGDERESLDLALASTIAQMRSALEALDDPYLRERAADMDAIGQAIVAALRGETSALHDLPRDSIIVAADLTPAATAGLRGGSVAGFATAYGGPTGHTAILARALGIPAVVGLGEAALAIPDGASLILDGSASMLIVDPRPEEREAYARRVVEQNAAQARLQELRDTPGSTADGQLVALWANIGHPDEAKRAVEYGAEGVGLFRTEFLFLDRDAPPDEELQFAAYRATLDAMAGRTIIVRTLDVGGDKPLPYLDVPVEANPFLGVRGLRLCMRRPDLFAVQLRALLRAAVYGDLWVMLPMVATLEDVRWGRAQLQAAAAALAAEGVPHRADVPLGVMIETPAAAVTADVLAGEVAFFSVGSNDLAQYALAVDRGQAELAARYPHDSQAVLRLIATAAQAAARAGIPIGVCGELAGLPNVAPLLVGMGVMELSMSPAAIPHVKDRLRSTTLAEAQAAARQALETVE